MYYLSKIKEAFKIKKSVLSWLLGNRRGPIEIKSKRKGENIHHISVLDLPNLKKK